MKDATEKLGHLSRRTFLRLAGMTAAGGLLAACAPAAGWSATGGRQRGVYGRNCCYLPNV
jgi:hypothetical protein